MNKIDKILTILGVFLLLFAAADFYVFVKVGSEPAVLVGSVAGAVIAEIIVLFRIKAGKQRLKYESETKDEQNPS